MKFLIDYKDNKFSLAQSLSENTWAGVSSISGSTELFTIRFLRFDCKFKFEFTSNICLTYECIEGIYHTAVKVSIKDDSSDNIFNLNFDSFKPLCEAESTNKCKAFVWFLNFVNQFDCAVDVSTVVETDDIFSYSDSELLRTKIEALSLILTKYANKPYFKLSNLILDWICKSLLRFGLSATKLKQVNEDFPQTVLMLNSKGYSINSL